MSELRDLKGRKIFKTFIPYGPLVAVAAHPQHHTQGGLVLPDGTPDPGLTITGTVVAVGAEVKYVKEGEVVLLREKTMGTWITHGGSGSVVLLRDDQVVGTSLV